MAPKRFLQITVTEDADTVRLVIGQTDRIGETYVVTFGQSRDAMALPAPSDDQWRRDMLVWALEEL